ncbi:MAG: helix-turn-helix transcriptional regulator [Acidovorax sp.]|nr:helix-turn-helix transcriptional regulator [Acidovorax sp.]
MPSLIASSRAIPGPGLPGQPATACAMWGFEEDLPHTVRRLEVAHAGIKLIIGWHAAYGVRLPAGTLQPYQSLVAGLGGGPVVTEHRGAQSCVEVTLAPWLGFQLFHGSPEVLSCSVVALADVWGSAAMRLSEQLHHAPDWPARFALVQQCLQGMLARSRHTVQAPVRQAWEMLSAQRGNLPVSALCRAVGWSERHLALQSCHQLGDTPKRLARRLRFGAAHQALEGITEPAGQTDLADLAARCGYADQSHLSREFRHFAGCSPAAYQRAGFVDVPGKPASLVESVETADSRG